MYLASVSGVFHECGWFVVRLPWHQSCLTWATNKLLVGVVSSSTSEVKRLWGTFCHSHPKSAANVTFDLDYCWLASVIQLCSPKREWKTDDWHQWAPPVWNWMFVFVALSLKLHCVFAQEAKIQKIITITIINYMYFLFLSLVYKMKNILNINGGLWREWTE